MNYFAYPSMMGWLVMVAALWAAGTWVRRRRMNQLRVLGQPSTILRMLPAGLFRRRRWIQGLRITGLFAAVIALAGPLIGSRLVEYKQKGLDIFIAVDCSLSMQAEDFKPNRMGHAKLVLGQLIDRLAGSRVGIIAFAGQAYVECPLTVDEEAARDALDTIDVGTVPIPGTVIGDAIRVAIKGLKAGEGHNRVLVLLTDGEDHHSDPAGAAKEAAKIGLKIFPIGIGSPQGEPIPVTDDQGNRIGYKRDKKGEVVLSRLDESTLVELANQTGGHYLRASPTGDEVDELLRRLDALQQGDQKSRMFNRFENRYQWPLAFGLILLFISLAIPEMNFSSSPAGAGGGSIMSGPPPAPSPSRGEGVREGVTALKSLILLVCLSGWTLASQAQLKEGNRQFKNGNYDSALKLYEDALIDSPYSSILHFNAGDAAFMMGDFPKSEVSYMEAAKSTHPLLRGASHYNRGNALFYEGKLADAIEAYKDSLRANPNDVDAKYNLGVALKALKNPPPKHQQGQGKQDQKQGKSAGKNDKNQKQESGGKEQKPGQMSREDAERLLAAAGAGEKKKAEQKMPKGEVPHPDEDW